MVARTEIYSHAFDLEAELVRVKGQRDRIIAALEALCAKHDRRNKFEAQVYVSAIRDAVRKAVK